MSTLAVDAPLTLAGPGRKASVRPSPVGLGSCFAAHRWKILLTYALFVAENAALLARPWILGVAVNDLLTGSSRGVFLFVAQQLVLTFLVVGRQMYDTRVYTAMYSDVVTRLVVTQRRHRVGTSRVAARSSLSREIVDFYEQSVPILMRGLLAVGGSLVMLVIVDGWLAPAGLALLLPVYLMSVRYAKRSYALTGRLNDRLEGEVEVIQEAKPACVRRHFDDLARHRVGLSDLQAGNLGSINLLYLGLMVAALLRSYAVSPGDVGQIFALIGYVTMFAMGLYHAPMLVQQLTRLHDIQRRLNPPAGTA